MMKILITVLMATSFSKAIAESDYIAGTVNQYTSTAEGLMVMVKEGLPTNCEGTPYGWMLIPEENRTMIATALSAIAMNKRLTIYTNGKHGKSAYCKVIQVHPTI